MEVGRSLLAQTLRQSMTPVVMVMATACVEDSCHKNQLGLVDLLRPFCILNQINVPVRTASEQPYRLQEFQLRLFYSFDIVQMRAEAAEEHLLKLVTDSSSDAAMELQGDPRKLEVVRKMAESESLSSWFQKYSREFMRTLAFSEHETIDHPVACLLVVSSKDENPVNKFVDLFNTGELPALMNDGVMDPKILKHYVLLHDNQDGPINRAEEILLELRSTFGVGDCRLISINSTHPDAVSSVEDLWSTPTLPAIDQNAPKERDDKGEESSIKMRPGSYLDSNDVEELADFVLDFSQKHVIPYMEQKIRVLNQQVLATRKGLKNQIKNLWWRKGKDETSDAPGQIYTYSSMESQIRVLADYAFMLRDYELALSNYRLLASDYKTDKAWKRYAGVQEMIGLSLFMLDQNRKEAETCMDAAFISYQKSGPVAARHSTRCALWWAEIHKARGQYREAAGVLFRAATEMEKEATLRAGVLLEQAAYCYLRSTPPMLRKYGFHLVLAGNRYHVSGQRKHAIRTYMSILSIYEGQGWNYISDHVHFHLGRLSAFLGRIDIAVQHFMNLIACSHQSAANQTIFLKEFLQVVQNLKEKGEMLDLSLPCISEHIFVHFEDHRTYSSASATDFPEQVWSSLEEGLVPAVPATVTTWLDAPSKMAEQTKDFNVSVAGEEIRVDVEFSNPLQITVEVSAVSLFCEVEVYTGESLREQKKDEIDDSFFLNRTEESFTLKAGEKKIVSLKVTPIKECRLKLLGVKWILSGIASGRRYFPVLTGKKRQLKGRGVQDRELSPHQRLKFHVVGCMPRLQVSLHELPDKVNTGEIHRLVLELLNPTPATVKNIRLRASSPAYLLVGEPGDLDSEFPHCLEDPRSVVTFMEQQCGKMNDALSSHGSIFSFPKDTILESSCSLLWPLWFHARSPGTIALNMVVYYEPLTPEPSMKYRTVRISHILQVLPSLCLSVQISPCASQIEQCLLRLDIENQHSSESFWLRQVSCIGHEWCITPLNSVTAEHGENSETGDATVKEAFLSSSVSPPQLLPSSQTSSFFFQLQHTKTLRQDLQALTSDIRLGPPSSTEPLVPVNTGPIYHFHQLERSLQLNTKQKVTLNKLADNISESLLSGPEFVDLVLVCGQQDSMIVEKRVTVHDNVRLATHHVCHCSVKGSTPVVWAMEGPSLIVHNFLTDPFYEASVSLTVRNCANTSVWVKVETLDLDEGATGATGNSLVQGKQVGWCSTSPVSQSGDEPTVDVISAIPKTSGEFECDEYKGVSPCGPYMWCSQRSTTLRELAAGSVARVPLHVTFFAPGIYDLSSYRVSWKLFLTKEFQNLPLESEEKKGSFKGSPMTRSSSFIATTGLTSDAFGNSSQKNSQGSQIASEINTGAGHPFLLTLLQDKSL
ncbi:hypothetical protein O6H91_18G041600 [Diphasiastrum complanatum]|uniref:Uncharacterized protein n=2 Tax=Diphasiastrum complanatum TaxID=34168 RepID=A0ACC2B0B2_DIPCM|nr:hypothetical protein O6H91_18G041600 [Diphasiastrum complanatum]